MLTDGRTDERTDGRTEIWTPISHPAISRCDKNLYIASWASFRNAIVMTVLPIKFIKLMQDAGVGLMLRDQCNITITEKLKYLA